jgi:BirA family biotin operon repressor/biotin-[acetyl-CoA-carboxylase] ligase
MSDNNTGKTTKEKILSMLEQSRDYVSGQDICDSLSLSRTAVWKHINTLRAEGYEIASVNNRGYKLNGMPDIINEKCIKDHLHTKWLGQNVIYYEETDSSNNKAKQLGEEGEKDGTVVVVDRQTAGKGRRGKNWISPAGNCYFSILLYPDVRVDRASMVTLVAAIAVSEAVREVTGIDTRIKWPNDVVAGGKKICGILTESSTDMEYIQYVVVGIGINCNQKEFENEIKDMATSISLETGKDVERAKLLAKVFEHFERYYTLYLETEDLSKLYDRYNELLINKDRDVKIIENGRERIMKAIGINEVGALIVEDSDGRQETVISGEVSVRGLYGYV